MAEILLKGDPIGRFKGVLFDKDGTLSSSEPHLKKIAILRIQETIQILGKHTNKNHNLGQVKYLLKAAYGLNENGLDPNGSVAIASRQDNLISTATILSLQGIGWSKSIDLANEVFLTVDNINIKNSIENNIRPLLSGVHNMLNKLINSKVKCAIISNDTREGISSFLKLNHLETKFLNYWSCEDKPSKPSPSAVIELCKIIKLQPHECILIGDSDSDLKMAQEAGIGLAMGYVSGWSSKPMLTYQNKLISNWEELSCH